MSSDLTIRPAHRSDDRAIARLAALDSSAVPAGELLLAEICGRPVAAIGVDSGAHIADPFLPTADVVALLELRAHPERGGATRSHAHLKFPPRVA